MAFVSMVIVFLLIAAVFLGLLLIAGVVLLIVGIVGKSKAKNAGKKLISPPLNHLYHNLLFATILFHLVFEHCI